MRTWRAPERALWRDERGGVAILAAAGLAIVTAMSALAVDMGSVYYETRRLQGIADAAALAAAGNLPSASAAAGAAIAANRWARPVTPVVTTGSWAPNVAVPVDRRFVPGAATRNAARVVLSADAPLYFGRLFGISSAHISRAATAARIDLASFSIGSRVAALDGGIANALLGGLTGSTVTLTAADYDALLAADVDLLAYVAALRTETGTRAGSYDRLLATSVTLPQAIGALRRVLGDAGQAGAAAALARLLAAGPAGSILPSALIQLGQIGSQDRAGGGTALHVSAYALLETMLQLAGGGRQVKLDLATAAPGLVSLTATVSLGERMQNSPWIAVTDKGDPIVSTAQARIAIEATIKATPPLAALNVATVRLPLFVEVGTAQARLSALNCTAAARTATLEVQPSIGHVSIADVTALSSPAVSEAPATLVNLLNVAKVTGSARFDASDRGWQTVPFSALEVDTQAIRTVRPGGVVSGIAGSLAGQMGLAATLGPLGLPSPSTAALVKPLLADLAAPIDEVLGRLLDTLGLGLGQADVRINGVRCGSAALVA